MPRIEMLPPEDNDDGSCEEVDLCASCAATFTPAAMEYWPEDCEVFPVEHPPYSDTHLTCELCGKVLTDADNEKAPHAGG